MPRRIVIDSGFWFALFEVRDEHHTAALTREPILNSSEVLIPWPSLYEVLNTKLCKNRYSISQFESYLRRPRFYRIDDRDYRESALNASLAWSKSGKRAISLVDMVIRLMLDDVNVNANALLTFNPGDFHDVCRSRRVELLA